LVFFLVFTGEAIMAIQMFETPFIIEDVEGPRCPVDSHEGFGWSDSQGFVIPENGDKTNPIIYPTMGYHPSYGVGNLYSIIKGFVPEPGWKVIGKCGPNNGTWVCVPPWYVFKKEIPPSPNRWPQAIAALAVGALVLWGGMQVLPQGNAIPTTYETK
jgi:hypothetical protein